MRSAVGQSTTVSVGLPRGVFLPNRPSDRTLQTSVVGEIGTKVQQPIWKFVEMSGKGSKIPVTNRERERFGRKNLLQML